MCLTPKNGLDHEDDDRLVLSSVCDQLQNFVNFVPSEYYHVEKWVGGEKTNWRRRTSWNSQGNANGEYAEVFDHFLYLFPSFHYDFSFNPVFEA